MAGNKPIAAESKYRISIGRLAGLLAAAWFVYCVATYVFVAYGSRYEMLTQLKHSSWRFFEIQAGVFFASAIIAEIIGAKRAVTAFFLGGYLILSTALFLAVPCDFAFIVKLALFIAWISFAANGMRRLILRFAGPNYGTWAIAVAAVFAAMIPISFFLGLFGAITPGIVLPLAVLVALPGAVMDRNNMPAIPRRLARWLGGLSIFDFCILETIWLVLAMTFVGACAGEYHSDAIRVHFPYIHQVVWEHGISHQYACWHRLQPMAMQTSCAMLSSLGGDVAAKWYCWLVLPSLTLLVVEEVRRRSGSDRLGLLAGAALLGCPLMADLATSIYVINVMALLCTAGFILLFRSLQPPCTRGIVLSTLIMASMMQIKYTGLVFCAVWGAVLAIGLFAQCTWRAALIRTIAAGALLAAAASPWFIYVYAGTGNPFYPYLHSWFPSPYWADGFTVQQVFEEVFNLKPGVLGVVSFPWDATFETNLFLERPGGHIGFWVLALAPCLFLARPRKAGTVWSMALASVAMIAGIVSYTPYIRYWMPAYPLLLIACMLAVGLLFRPLLDKFDSGRDEKDARFLLSPIRIVQRLNPLVMRWSKTAGVFLIIVTLLPLPLMLNIFSWQEYTQLVGKETMIEAYFNGYPAVRQLNKILSPGENVMCTSFEAIHLIKAPAVEYQFWWDHIHHIDDLESFNDFRQRNHFRYWVVKYFRIYLDQNPEIKPIISEYWTDERLVTGWGTVAVYDISEKPIRPWNGGRQTAWPTMLDESDKDWAVSDDENNWIGLNKSGEAKQEENVISLAGPKRITHRLDAHAEGECCRVKLDVKSSETTHPLVEIAWFDKHGDRMASAVGGSHGEGDYQTWLYSRVPEGAKTGWVSFWERNDLPIQLVRTAVTFWPLAGSAEEERKAKGIVTAKGECNDVR